MLTYCTNIHPGESWADVMLNLESHFLTVKDAVSPAEPFPIGLRLSHQAAGEVTPDEAQRFRDWCEARNSYVLTVNGFPYGTFHGEAVKERVYDPDWRDRDRVIYTKRIADLLAEWLPEGVPGSISTVPIAFKRGFDDAHWPLVRRHLLETLEHLERLRQQHKCQIILALEPEPRCVLETTAEVVAFFERMMFPDALADLAGICFDCCHQAVQFENPSTSAAWLRASGVRIGKIQVSSALRAAGPEIDALERFDEPTYLHQVVARLSNGTLLRYTDLPEFLAAWTGRGAGFLRASIEECRVHFHVPIFAEHLGPCGTTRFFLEEMLACQQPLPLLEVETYSWSVLPPDLRATSVAESVARELQWVQRTLREANGRP